MDDLFRAFTFKALQQAADIITILQREGLSNEEYLEFIEDKRLAFSLASRERVYSLMPKCPKCNIPMSLIEGDNNDSHWVCMKCRYSVYNPESVENTQKKVLEEARNGV